MSMAERKIENKQIIISYSASLFIATKFPEGQVISILLATRGQFERVVPFWSPTEYSSAKKDYLRSQITIFNVILDDIPSNLLGRVAISMQWLSLNHFDRVENPIVYERLFFKRRNSTKMADYALK